METGQRSREIRNRGRELVRQAKHAAGRATRSLRRLPRRMRRNLRRLALGLALLLLAVAALDVLADEPVRASIERRMNGALDGYTVHLGKADFKPWSLALDLEDIVLTQDVHPDPAVLDLAAFEFSVQWRALLFLRLVADARILEPRLFVHLAQLREERTDEVALEDRGWDEAVEEAYPLKINELRIVDGSVTYIDEDPERPLELTNVEAVAHNLRNVESPELRYPSSFRATAAVFDSGRAEVRGRADFLADPIVDLTTDGRIEEVPLDRLGPLIEDYRLTIGQGEMSAHGRADYGPRRKHVALDEVLLDGVHVDYVNDPELTRRAVEAVAKAKRAPRTEIEIRRARLIRSELAFVNRTQDPDYRVFVAALDLTLADWSNQPEAAPSRFRARGAFMGSGRTAIQGHFRPDRDGPDFDLAVAIEGTDLEAMNDLLRAHANLDATEGSFSFFSEIRVTDQRIDGYVKPLFHDVEVYDRQQDREDGFFHKLWERIAEGLAEILENRPREEVATVADISGPLSNPDASNLQVVLNLIENAFFEAILPGFREREESRGREEGRSEEPARRGSP
jgi:hypothetical protein